MFGRTDSQQPETTAQPAEPTTVADSTPANDQSWQHPGAPIDSNPAPAEPTTVAPVFTAPAIAADDTSHDTGTATNTNELLDIKQDALNQLSPLVGHLDQSPEEKFRTTMMMIQASDNQSLVKSAYDAAQAIPDEAARAQALLDVINEINYFTQHKDS